MTVHIPKCTSKRHKWKHVKNVERLKYSKGGTSYMVRGMYKCENCGEEKFGGAK